MLSCYFPPNLITSHAKLQISKEHFFLQKMQLTKQNVPEFKAPRTEIYA